MQSPDSGLYQVWLQERGLETPAVEAAGVFLRDIAPDRTSLIVAIVSEENAIQELELLKRLGAALNVGVSIVAVASASSVPWHWLLSFHTSLNQLILLGSELHAAMQRSGAIIPQHMLITGETPAVLNQDVSAKRALWQKIQNHTRH